MRESILVADGSACSGSKRMTITALHFCWNRAILIRRWLKNEVSVSTLASSASGRWRRLLFYSRSSSWKQAQERGALRRSADIPVCVLKLFRKWSSEWLKKLDLYKRGCEWLKWCKGPMSNNIRKWKRYKNIIKQNSTDTPCCRVSVSRLTHPQVSLTHLGWAIYWMIKSDW